MRRIHRERAQPQERKKYGLLEKHKDYKIRANAYHKKQEALQRLREKAAFKNPDEFNFKMIRSKMVDGVHKPKAWSHGTTRRGKKSKAPKLFKVKDERHAGTSYNRVSIAEEDAPPLGKRVKALDESQDKASGAKLGPGGSQALWFSDMYEEEEGYGKKRRRVQSLGHVRGGCFRGRGGRRGGRGGGVPRCRR
ncbi:PREDICTED: U3 small nucleolar RNA-associated protein 11-like [Tarenaya hassleriana]|uniref:U3 small nucleolar RNA-associated protein 11-like n=1 Tax=Tarenaya hassleriana TaxID=28532 RepID=UPI00053C8FBE|nr:PREDICTED: U3 small nucleolar RNA-associated protein 11-like [Tarenaya hassleriana]